MGKMKQTAGSSKKEDPNTKENGSVQKKNGVIAITIVIIITEHIFS